MLIFFKLFHAHKSSPNQFSGEVSDFFKSELYDSVLHREKSVVFAALDVFSGMEFRSPLPDNYVSNFYFLIAENLHA